MAWLLTPITPYEGQTNLDVYTRFTWSRYWFGEFEKDPIPSSWLWIADDIDLTVNLQKIEVPTNTFYDLTSPLDKETDYYWGVGTEELVAPTTVFKFTTGLYPDIVLLLTPLDEATGELIQPTLTWSAAADADTYDLVIFQGGNLVYGKTGITGTYHEIETVLSYNTEYSWYIKGENDNGNYGPPSESWIFTTETAPQIGDTTLIYPLNTDTDIPLKPLFDWSDVYGVVFYSYEIARDSGFLDIVTSGNTTLSHYQLAVSLEYNTQYWWRIKASDNYTTGNWVSDNFTTKAEPGLSIPTVYDPYEGQTDFEVPGTVKWSYFGAYHEDLKYRIQITLQTDTTWSSLFDEEVLTEAEYFVYQPTMDYVEDYMVRVRAETVVQTGDWSIIVNFATESEGNPGPPTLIYPEQDDEDISVSPTMTWTSVQFADSYNLQIATNSSFNDIIVNITGLTVAQYIANLDVNTEYWWRVRSYNDNNSYWSAFSEIWHFTTIATSAPGVPILISPFKGEEKVDPQPMFIWGDTTNADTYQIKVTEIGLIETVVVDIEDIIDTFLSCPIILKKDIQYWWKVRAKNETGYGEWSDTFHFFTEAGYEIKTPVLLIPHQYEGEVNVLTYFEWRAPKGSRIENNSDWGFEIRVALDEAFTQLVFGEVNIQEEHITLTVPLDYNGKFWWKVRQRDGYKYSPWADSWSFKTEQISVPSPPVIYMPNYGEEVIIKPTIKWNNSTSRENETFLNSYDLQISKDIGFKTIKYEINTALLEHTVLNDLDNDNFYYVRVRGCNSSGYGLWSETVMFYTEKYSGPTPETMDLQIQFKVDVLTNQFILTDLIGLGGNYIGVTVDELRGLFKLTGPSGIVYENPGWDTDDFSSPDTTGETGSENWATDSKELPTDSLSKMATGEYTIEYKLREDAGGTVISSNLTKIMWLYEGLTPVIDYSIEMVKSRMLISDNTVYDISMFGSQLIQQNDLDSGYRTWVVRFPIGAGFVSTIKHERQIYVGPNLWSGNYDVQLESVIKYLHDVDTFLQVEFSDTVDGKEDKIYVSRNGCMDDVLACLEVLTSKFEFAKTNNLNTRDATKNMIEQIMAYYNMYQMALLTGKDTDYSCNRLKDLLAQAACTCAEVDNSVSKEINPVIPPDAGEGSTAGFYKYEFIATEGQQSFPLPITLTDDCPIFVNGNLLAEEDYSGIGTQTLILTTPASRYDVVVVFKYE